MTRVIEDSCLSDFMPLMSNGEILGCHDGVLSCVGAYDEEGRPTGIAITEILPDYIRLYRLEVCPGQNEKMVSEELTEVIRRLPKEHRMPVYAFIHEANMQTWMNIQRNGFYKEKSNKSHWMRKVGQLSDMKAGSITRNAGVKVFFADKVDSEELLRFAINAPHDDFMQFPYANLDRFSDSLVCKAKGRISGMMLTVESEGEVLIPWFHFTNEASTNSCFTVFREMLLETYIPETKIVFIVHENDKRNIVDPFFDQMETSPLYIYKAEPLE